MPVPPRVAVGKKSLRGALNNRKRNPECDAHACRNRHFDSRGGAESECCRRRYPVPEDRAGRAIGISRRCISIGYWGGRCMPSFPKYSE